MNQSHDDMITTYRQCDFSRRMDMYMQYPSLRPAFIAVDREDWQTFMATPYKAVGKIPARRLAVFFGALAGSIKNRFGLASG